MQLYRELVLVISDATVTSVDNSSQTIEVAWTTTNQGTVTTAVDWDDNIFLSGDPIYDDSDINIITYWNVEQTPLAPKESYTIKSTLR